MKYIPRLIESQLLRAARSFPALILTKPRRSGKTTLLRKLFPHAACHLLEDPDVVVRVRSDPHTFLDEIDRPVILDEIQNTPELLNYIRTRIDRFPRKTGQWLLTGSQEAPLMKGVTESKANSAYCISSVVVHRSPKEPAGFRALRPGVRSSSLAELLTGLLQG
jgi:hypothetical protein